MKNQATIKAIKEMTLSPDFKNLTLAYQRQVIKQIEWENSPEGVHYDFAGIQGIENKNEVVFFHAIAQLPREIIDFAKKNIFFTGSSEEVWGECYNLKGERFKHYSFLVVLHKDLWKLSKKKIEETIAHEIAHAYLKHDILGEIKQELDADKQAGKWLGREINHYKKLMKKEI